MPVGNPSHYATCPTCAGSGLDPRKRARPCPEESCYNGRNLHCDQCGRAEPCGGLPTYQMDGSCLRSGPEDARTGDQIRQERR